MRRPDIGRGLARHIPKTLSLWRNLGCRRRPRSRDEGDGPLSSEEIGEASRELLKLQRGLTGSRLLAGSGYMDEPGALGAYLLYYWPVSYLQTAVALAELGLRPRRVLDIGSGPGPAAAALIDAGAWEVCLVDGSERALDLAAAMLDRGGIRDPLQRPPELRFLRHDLTKEERLPGGPFDLVVMSHCLNELWTELPPEEALARKIGLAERVIDLLAPGGVLLLIEPALLATNRASLRLRDELATRGRGIAGPCVGSFLCPILAAGQTRSCHAEAPWNPSASIASLAEASGLDRRSVKMTWFGFSRQALDSHRGIGDPLRVVSDPMLNKEGRIRRILCGREGLLTLSVSKDQGFEAASAFGALRRGDIVELEGTEPRGAGKRGLGPDSRIVFNRMSPVVSGGRPWT